MEKQSEDWGILQKSHNKTAKITYLKPTGLTKMLWLHWESLKEKSSGVPFVAILSEKKSHCSLLINLERLTLTATLIL